MVLDLAVPVVPGAMVAQEVKGALGAMVVALETTVALEAMVVVLEVKVDQGVLAAQEVKVALGDTAAPEIMADKEDLDPRRSSIISSNSGPSSDLRRRIRRSPSKDRWTLWLTLSTVLLPEFFW